jgi:hypothetical protein
LFKNNLVQSILKKKRLSDEQFSKEYENELGKTSMKFVDRTSVRANSSAFNSIGNN